MKYPKEMSVVSFVDWLINWLEAFAMPDKEIQTVIGLWYINILP